MFEKTSSRSQDESDAEMKHGPIALISEDYPSVLFATEPDTLSKILSKMQEVIARKGQIIVVRSSSCHMPNNLADEEVVIPDCHPAVAPILASIPVQLLSHYIVVERGCDVDKPRNLAKSVTAE